jgi:hypothetical protein
MRHFQHAQRRRIEQTRDLRLGLAADVTGEHERHAAPAQFQHDGIIVAHLLALPIRQRRMGHAYRHAVQRGAVGALKGRPTRARRRCALAQHLHRFQPRHGHAVPDVPRAELAEHGRRAADVVGVAVGQRKHGQAPNAVLPQHWCNDAVPYVEGPAAPEAAGVHKETRSAGKPHEGGVPLPDIDEGHVQQSVAVCCPQAVGNREHPDSGRGRDRRAHPARSRKARSTGRPDLCPCSCPQKAGPQHSRVVQSDGSGSRSRHAPCGPRHQRDQFRGSHESFRARVCNPADRPRGRRRRKVDRHCCHPGELSDSHQRNGPEVEEQAGERHTRKDGHRYREQRRFRRR